MNNEISINNEKNFKDYFKWPKSLSCFFENDYDLKIYFNYKPFDGHQTRLGHYYRHLFSMVNHVVKQEEISYEEKRDYLKILRAQFSVYELTLLFYNFYSEFGIGWENKYGSEENDLNKKGNSFFLDYRFLHNIEDDYRFNDIKPSEILNDKVSIHRNVIKCKKDFDLDYDPVFELY